MRVERYSPAWTQEIEAEWRANEADYYASDGDGTRVIHALGVAYFTPRPYRNEWDRGDGRRGFTFTVQTRGGYRDVVVSYLPSREAAS